MEILNVVKVLVGGVNSPARAKVPFIVKRGSGPFLEDTEGRRYVDYCLGYGPMILGHSHPEVTQAVTEQLKNGSVFGVTNELEAVYARKIADNVPNAEMVRAVNSGTEATMLAVRLARGFTGRNKIVKFYGGYHGAHDAALVKAGSAALGAPDSEGVPEEVAKNTLVIEFNGLGALEKILKQDIACLIGEPVMANCGLIVPEDGYWKEARKLCSEHGTLLVFDEVVTGFRLGLGGAQEYFGVDADLVTLGKIAGGGLPMGVVCGKGEVMEKISPAGRVYNAGTFNGNPVTMAAGLKTIEILERGGVYQNLESNGRIIMDRLRESGANVNGLGSMFQVFFTKETVKNYSDALRSDRKRFMGYFEGLLREGIFVPPSQFESCFISTKHTAGMIDETLEAMIKVIEVVK